MTTTTATGTTTPSAATTASTAAPTTGIKADFNMFLKLLTTQMQNQDPLSPMDTSQYTQQLVQYSQVEQSVQQNTTLNSILSNLSNQGLTQASGMIGRSVTLNSDVAGLAAGTPAAWSYSAARPVSTLTSSITDASGKVVMTSTMTPNAQGTMAWDGTLADGSTAPAGSYTLALTASDAAGNSVPVTIHAQGTVQEVSSANGALTLKVNGAAYTTDKLIGVAATAN
ncbi:flagellar basal-body rod modification protein FlgD [Sphingomonas sp. BE270]|jgi:flagellar basal-body rod modification protein FlgD|uniref:flagellar hook assembly protein FlgD n=1 Tax=unclassified Sphingomonas TaxID=196159 RepID=UPI00053F282B|nr:MULTISPECIES: flagellar hook capping FlgD N-terminal domain-containing protein [unclassified Sphingomonas]MDR6848696.1 flagellar basal-body rod modification protein FlgD [Sphingomonas sp. BE137]MDR7255978.1 flagellar basal-body rod modification protein FlgD [Sphingomonas sp. BE270]